MRGRFTDESEAKAVLARKLAELRRRSYDKLAATASIGRFLLGGRIQIGGAGNESVEVTGESGTIYEVDTMIAWDGRRPGNVRVIVSVAELHPRWDVWCNGDFIMAPDGTFLGE